MIIAGKVRAFDSTHTIIIIGGIVLWLVILIPNITFEIRILVMLSAGLVGSCFIAIGLFFGLQPMNYANYRRNQT